MPDMTPEEALTMAGKAINQEQWDKATAFATAGLLSLCIGGALALAKLEDDG